jgi:DNA-directed RNA polymerase specialized sigma24 family protein
MLETSSDETLLGLASSRDEEALRLLYGRYSRAVYSLARRMLRDETDAEEVVQDVFVKVGLRGGRVRSGPGAASTWLLSIAHHATVDTVRRRNVRATVRDRGARARGGPLTPVTSREAAIEKVGRRQGPREAAHPGAGPRRGRLLRGAHPQPARPPHRPCRSAP